jgi:ribonuclease VapC
LTLFVDASAMVAFIAGEAEREIVAAEIASDPDPLWSAMACWEAVSALRNSYELTVDEARDEVDRAAAMMELRLVRIDRDELTLALDAYGRFGKGSGHRARLNMGDCFAYACARTNNARLLYKGDDFVHTDLA